MPRTDTHQLAVMAYKPSAAVFAPTRQALMLDKLFSSRKEESRTSHTVVTELGNMGTYNAAPSTMATYTFSQSETSSASDSKPSLDLVLFDARATAKQMTSRVSMYLREGWRDKLFCQLDNLLDPEEWGPEDKPLQEQSFDTFLKAICDLQPTKRPRLGLAYSGNLIAGWRANVNGEDRVSLEFAPAGRVTLIGSRFIDGEPVSFSARAHVRALKKTMASLNCAEWLGCV